MHKRAAQPCGAATPEEADARCKRAHPLPPACCIIPQDLGTKVPLVCPCEPLCGLLRGRVAPAPEEDFEPFSGGFEQAFGAPKKKQEKGIGAFLRQCPFTAARSASYCKGLRVLKIDAFFEGTGTV